VSGPGVNASVDAAYTAASAVTLDSLGRVGTEAAPYRMTGWDTLIGGIPVLTGDAPLQPLEASGPTPLEALEALLVQVLARPPCVVGFSGGRDSSAMLAISLDVARRNGLPEPVPVTLRYPGDSDADESEWQEMVIEHLGISEWERIDIPPSSSDMLGEVGGASLVAHGMIWPSSLHLLGTWLPRCAGATVITGEAGDEILGPRRATPVRLAARIGRHHPRSLSRGLFAKLAEETLPPRLRADACRRRLAAAGYLDWLQPELREQSLRDVARLTAREPWSWREAIRRHPRSPRLLLGETNRSWLARFHNVTYCHPLLATSVVDAIARHGGRLGYAGRTDAMRRIFGSLLPEAVVARSTKASFNSAITGPATRSFAQSWDGTGVPTDLVDIDRLRMLWKREVPHVGTLPLLQAAWLTRQLAGSTGAQAWEFDRRAGDNDRGET
jgi:asparagine synthase (glutamine-hydrolysing)